MNVAGARVSGHLLSLRGTGIALVGELEGVGRFFIA
ncbi:hypothetical protein HNR46_000545 [Haloferula luteola]|uniref:Uncharacterized protein n=1 Tax=Haloferula luteola TaxID=595692 RepID=A0A840VBQ7_9BACT|nr:hypothetical protein [Haloferula luteola]